MTGPRVIAIDGAAGSGKSTLARALARKLGFAYVNTGWMYRALALTAARSGVDPEDGPALANLIQSLQFRLVGDRPPTLEVEGQTHEELATLEVERTVSAVSRHPDVRAAMRAIQRSLGESVGAVMEGRDIGSVVFPDAPVKLYLVADPSVRAARRSLERGQQHGQAVARRDAHDARTVPFEPPEGAHVLDTSSLDVPAALEGALAVVRRLAPELLT